MPTLRVPCTVIKSIGHDMYGAEKFGARRAERCAVLKLYETDTQSTLRPDSGASKGAAHEIHGFAKLLLGSRTSAEIGDLITINGGDKYRVVKKFPRYSGNGKVDHYEAECSIG